MANQIIIDIGAVANDGTGDPLRTAFNYVNDNFSNVWATGVANSNIGFDGNKIITTNTNGNLVLAPNGIGKVVANVDIQPNANNTLSLGATDKRWNTVYARNLDVSGNTTFDGNISITNDLTVGGNLTVSGTTTSINTANLDVEDKVITIAYGSPNATVANGSGITVAGANANIIWSNTLGWTFNTAVSTTGNITAPYFIGNGSQLTGITSYSNANVSAYLASGTDTANIITTGNVTGAYVSGNIIAPGSNQDMVFNRSGVLSTASGFNYNYSGNILYAPAGAFAGDSVTGVNGLFAGVGSYTVLGSDILGQFTGNVDAYSQINSQNTSNGVQASGDIIITADNGTDSTHFINLGMTSSTWDGSQPNSLGNRLGPNDGYLYVQDGDLVLGTNNGSVYTWKFDQAGNLTVPGDIIPAGNNTQSLGTNTNRWSNLYLSGNTIYLGDLSLSAGADGLTSTAGFDLGNSVATDITANVLSANTVNIGTGAIGIGDDNYLVVETLVPGGLRPSNDDTYNLGNVSHRWAEVHANVYYGDGSQLTGLNLTSISNDGSIVDIVVPNGDVTITADSTQTWAFDTTGNLNLPANGDLNFNGGSIAQTLNEDIYIRASDDENDGWSVYNVVDDGAGNILSQTRLEFDQYTIRTDAQGAAYTWAFRDTGVLELPGDIYGNVGDNLTIKIGDQAGSDTFIDLQTRSYVGDALISNIRIANPNVTISTAGAAYNWTFDGTGNLTVPGNTVISTANATGNVVGKSINIRAGAADQTDYYATAGGNLNLIGGLGASNDGGGGGPGGDVNITSGLSADSAGHAGNVNITSGTNGWVFDYNGSTQFPNSTITDPGTVNQINLNDSSGIKISTFDTNDIVIETDVDGGDGGTWTFYNDGSFGPGLEGQANSAIYLTGRGATGSSYLRWNNNQANVALPSDTYITAGNGVANISILNSGVGGFTRSWVFDATGNLTLPGNITGNTAGYAIGYRDIPQVSFTGNATIATTDAGKHFYSTQSSNYTLTIANNASQGFQVGAAITVVNQGTGTITVAQGSGVTLYMAGNATSGNRSVATFGMATLIKVATDTWFINGTGVS